MSRRLADNEGCRGSRRQNGKSDNDLLHGILLKKLTKTSIRLKFLIEFYDSGTGWMLILSGSDKHRQVRAYEGA